MGPSQFRTPEGSTRRKSAAASSVPVGGNTSDDRRIPAWTAAILIGAGLVLVGFDRAKFKMVVGVS